MAHCRSDSSIHLPSAAMRTGASRSGTCLIATMIFIFYALLLILNGRSGNPRATSCAMSINSGAPSPRAANASRNIVLQKGQAAATTLRAGCGQFRRAHVAHALAFLLAKKSQGRRRRRSRSCARASAALQPVRRPAPQPGAARRRRCDSGPDSRDRERRFSLRSMARRGEL